MKPALLTLTATGVVLMFVSPATAQQPQHRITFSVDFQGPTVMGPGPFTGLPDFFGGPGLDEGSILTPGLPGPPGPNLTLLGPLPPPGRMVSAVPGGPGTVPGGLGFLPGVWGAVELDALSYGRDRGQRFFFSVDEWALGIPGTPAPPAVWTEGALGPAFEASADVFNYLGPPGPMAPGPVFGNTGVVDGNGLPSVTGFVYPGVGLIEPNPAGPGPDRGDNLDAVDMNTTLRDVNGLIFFSLDSDFADPRELTYPPINSGTAPGNGFVGGDVLVSSAGGVPAVYASAAALGLDLIAGPDSDDLDALILLDDGDGVYTPGVDQILFSVRRGSAVIGTPDSLWGALIEAGDILVPGGPSTVPGIFIPAEALGLGTSRIHANVIDDLDALDRVPEPATLALLAVGGLAVMRRRR
jgi:hypothetical protein